jgi:hypothetical protein
MAPTTYDTDLVVRRPVWVSSNTVPNKTGARVRNVEAIAPPAPVRERPADGRIAIAVAADERERSHPFPSPQFAQMCGSTNPLSGAPGKVSAKPSIIACLRIAAACSA